MASRKFGKVKSLVSKFLLILHKHVIITVDDNNNNCGKHHSKKRKPLLKLIGNTLFKTKVKTNFYPFLGWFNWQKT